VSPFRLPNWACPSPRRDSCPFLAEASPTFLWSRLSDYTGREPVVITASGRKFEVLVHDAKSRPGHGRVDRIHDQLRPLQDPQWPHGEVLDGSLHTGALLYSHCIAGFFNGTLVRNVVGKLTDSTNRTRASGLMPLVWALGVTIGLASCVRWSLSHPHERPPNSFGNRFCEEYPRTSYCACSPQCFMLPFSFSHGRSRKRSGGLRAAL